MSQSGAVVIHTTQGLRPMPADSVVALSFVAHTGVSSVHFTNGLAAQLVPGVTIASVATQLRIAGEPMVYVDLFDPGRAGGPDAMEVNARYVTHVFPYMRQPTVTNIVLPGLSIGGVYPAQMVQSTQTTEQIALAFYGQEPGIAFLQIGDHYVNPHGRDGRLTVSVVVDNGVQPPVTLSVRADQIGKGDLQLVARVAEGPFAGLR